MVHINPIFPYPSYVPDKPPSNPAEGAGTGSVAVKNNPPAISRELQADILDIRNRYERIAKPIERLGADVNNLDLKVNNKYPVFGSLTANNDDFSAVKTTLGVLSPIPTLRRINSLPDSLEQENIERALGLSALALAHLPGDWTEVKLAGKELTQNILKGKPIPIEAKMYEYPRYFFKNTFMKGLPERFALIDTFDKTLFDTKVGDYFKRIFNVQYVKKYANRIEYFKERGIQGRVYQFTGKTTSNIVGKMLQRIPVLSVVAMSALEIPAIIRSVTNTEGSILDKGKALGKQLIKSAGYVGLVLGGIALAGAVIGTGALASLLAIGLGATVGLQASRELNKFIDKVIT